MTSYSPLTNQPVNVHVINPNRTPPKTQLYIGFPDRDFFGEEKMNDMYFIKHRIMILYVRKGFKNVIL